MFGEICRRFGCITPALIQKFRSVLANFSDFGASAQNFQNPKFWVNLNTYKFFFPLFLVSFSHQAEEASPVADTCNEKVVVTANMD